jgi:hypothetical protein
MTNVVVTVINTTSSALATQGVVTPAKSWDVNTITEAQAAQLATVAGVAVMDDAADASTGAGAALRNAIANQIIAGETVTPGVSYVIANGGAAQADVNAAGDDATVSTALTATLTASELVAVLVQDATAIINATSDSEERRKAAKVLELGRNPSESVSGQ